MDTKFLLCYFILWMSGVILFVGSFTPHWLEAEENGSSMFNGLFEKCFQEHSSGNPVCEMFAWPNFVNGTASYKIAAITTLFLASDVAAIAYIIISSTAMARLCCKTRENGIRSTRCCFIDLNNLAKIFCVVGVVLFNAAAIFFVGYFKEVQLFQDSTVGWSSFIYCVGYDCLVPLSLIAQCLCIENNSVPMEGPLLPQSAHNVQTDRPHSVQCFLPRSLPIISPNIDPREQLSHHLWNSESEDNCSSVYSEHETPLYDQSTATNNARFWDSESGDKCSSVYSERETPLYVRSTATNNARFWDSESGDKCSSVYSERETPLYVRSTATNNARFWDSESGDKCSSVYSERETPLYVRSTATSNARFWNSESGDKCSSVYSERETPLYVRSTATSNARFWNSESGDNCSSVYFKHATPLYGHHRATSNDSRMSLTVSNPSP